MVNGLIGIGSVLIFHELVRRKHLSRIQITNNSYQLIEGFYPITEKLLSRLIARLRWKAPMSMVMPKCGKVYFKGLAS